MSKKKEIDTTFKKSCIKLNNRMKGHPGKSKALLIYKRSFEAGPLFRKRYGKKVYYCSECGGQIEWIGQKECPHCHAKWTVKIHEDPKAWDRLYHLEFEAHGDIQVCRIYRTERHTFFGKKVEYNIYEVMRMMYSPIGERVLFARNVQPMSWYVDAFSYWSPITFKQEKYISWKAERRYNLAVDSYHVTSLTKQWKYKNIPSLMDKFNNRTLMLRLIAKPYGETLLKTGQNDMFNYLMYKLCPTLPKETIKAFNICTRNHYKIKDPSMWLDTIDLLTHYGYDTHNAKYVCPQNLNKIHDKLAERLAKENNDLELLRQIRRDKELAKLVATWHEHMGKIMDLHLTAKNLSIRPLQNVEEFKEEGAKMHHCVYAMHYWDYKKHPSSLILSAKDDQGHRLATIEYDKTRETIVQCRAACNAVPARDKEIRALINDNKATFDKLLKAA